MVGISLECKKKENPLPENGGGAFSHKRGGQSMKENTEKTRNEVYELCVKLNGTMIGIDIFDLELRDVVVDLSSTKLEYLERELVEQTFRTGIRVGSERRLKAIRKALDL